MQNLSRDEMKNVMGGLVTNPSLTCCPSPQTANCVPSTCTSTDGSTTQCTCITINK